MLTALLRPSRGTATIAGYDVRREPQRVRSAVGVLTEHHGLYARMSAWEYLDFFGRAYGLDKETRKKRSSYLLERFKLADVAHMNIGKYSKGMRQKLALARALIHEPPVLLLDEPTSAMDPESAQLVRSEIASLRSLQRAIILCTHNLLEAEKLANRVAIIYRGKILTSGSLDKLKREVLGTPEYEIQFSKSWDGKGFPFPPGVHLRRREERAMYLHVENPKESVPLLLQEMGIYRVPVISFREVPQTLEQVYLTVMKRVGGDLEGINA
jgi:ABC-2 type transport system ATP-binding protein